MMSKNGVQYTAFWLWIDQDDWFKKGHKKMKWNKSANWQHMKYSLNEYEDTCMKTRVWRVVFLTELSLGSFLQTIESIIRISHL